MSLISINHGDLHEDHSNNFQGKVKQIVGSTLQDSKDGDSSLITNYESDKSAAEYAKMYMDDGLIGGHVIMLGADPLSKAAAIEALHAYPGRHDTLSYETLLHYILVYLLKALTFLLV